MQKTCPFCRTEIDYYYAAVCPNCTRHQSRIVSRFLESRLPLSSNSVHAR